MARPQQRPRMRIEDVHNVASDDLDARVYVRPSVETVAKLWDSHGWEACAGRWSWIGRWALERMAADGRRILRAKAGAPIAKGPRRATTPEQEEAAFEVIMREGVHRAMGITGLSSGILYRIMRERGVTKAPRLSREEHLRASREGMARYMAARAAA